MTPDSNNVEYFRALEDFRRARAKAELKKLWSGITGKSESLLPYDKITSKIHLKSHSSKGLRDIPVNAIVGSVNRYQDFDKAFLPLHDESMERWAKVKAMMLAPGGSGLPPIQVYKIGDAYFVLDGNHRVSIAQHLEFDVIQAYVTEIRTKVNLSPDDSPEEIILKAEYAAFLEETQFDEIIPGRELHITFPGQYETIKEHIHVHRYYLGIQQSKEISWEEAVQSWYEKVYLPVVKVIREQNILYEFPERTETDLYLWILDHQTHMEKAFGWTPGFETTASDFVAHYSRRFIRVINRFYDRFRSIFLPKILSGSREPGEWFQQKKRKPQILFENILVALDGNEDSWSALDQAIQLAHLENARIHGLVVKKDKQNIDQNLQMITSRFDDKLKEAAINGRLVSTEGRIAETICERAKVNDLVVLKLHYPPSSRLFSRISSGLRLILRLSSRPILFVQSHAREIQQLLLAYDGSPKGKEALFIAAYLNNRYNKKLSILVVNRNLERGETLLQEAKDYLSGYDVEGVLKHPHHTSVSQVIHQVAAERHSDLIIMGGYGLPPLREIFIGSTVDGVLRRTDVPVLVCQ